MITRRSWSLAFGMGVPLGFVLASRVRAQQRPKVIGILSPYASAPFGPYRDVLVNAMRDLGHVMGTQFVLVERFADGRNERLGELAAELVSLKVDLIIAITTNAALAAKQATASIPIVFYGVGDPVVAGLADNLARPGRNLTGLANFSVDLNPKRLQLLKQMVPSLTRVAVLANSTNPYYTTQLERMQPSADRLGLRLLLVSASTLEDLEPAFKTMTQQHAEAVDVTADAYLTAEGQRIAELALRSQLPSMFAFADAVEGGGLMSYGIDPMLQTRQIAVYADKLLRGAVAAELPIEQPTQVDLVINRRTANALQLTVPQTLLLQAEKVIE